LSGGHVRHTLSFYNIKHEKTVPYSPTSHGLVEIQNRTITNLLRIFSLQFETHWLNVVPIAVYTCNTLPRIALANKSPFFMMYGKDPKPADQEKSETFFDIDKYAAQVENNRKFVELLREVLIQIRKKKNQSLNRKYLDFPEGTLVYVKNYSIQHAKKLKPVYNKTPEKVIKQYYCTVYTNDFLGRVRKHSKNNIKIAGARSLETFGKLPFNIQMIMGEPMDSERWDLMRDQGKLPKYLEDYQLDFENARVTRQTILDDTHLLEVGEGDLTGNKLEDAESPEDDLDEDIVGYLKRLHASQKLVTKSYTLKDLVKEYNIESKNFARGPVKDRVIALPPGISPHNVISGKRDRKKTVRFNFEK